MYNAIVVPILTYRTPVWYTGVGQKSLVQCLEVAQNEGIRKITGVFRMTPIEPLVNLTRIPPLSFVLPKLTHTFTLRLQGLNPRTKVRTVLADDQCCYWPKHFTPPTNLRLASAGITESTYRVMDPCTDGLWTHPRFTYVSELTTYAVELQKLSLAQQIPSDIHILIHPHTYRSIHIGIYFIMCLNLVICKGVTRGTDQAQAICQACKIALMHTVAMHSGHVYIWLRPKSIPDKLLMLRPHRDTHITADAQELLKCYLDSNPSHSTMIRIYRKMWKGTPQRADI